MCCNPCSLDIGIAFITVQTKCLSLLHKHHPESLPWKDTAAWWDCLHLHNIVSGFLVAKRPFLIISCLVRSFLLLPVLLRYFLHWSFLIILRSVVVILSYFLIRSVLVIQCFFIMIPECQVTVIWRKDCRVMGRRSTVVMGKAEPMGDILSYIWGGVDVGCCLTRLDNRCGYID